MFHQQHRHLAQPAVHGRVQGRVTRFIILQIDIGVVSDQQADEVYGRVVVSAGHHEGRHSIGGKSTNTGACSHQQPRDLVVLDLHGQQQRRAFIERYIQAGPQLDEQTARLQGLGLDGNIQRGVPFGVCRVQTGASFQQAGRDSLGQLTRRAMRVQLCQCGGRDNDWGGFGDDCLAGSGATLRRTLRPHIR